MNKDYFLGKKDKRFDETNSFDTVLSLWKEKVKTADVLEVLSFFSNSVSGKQIKEALSSDFIPYDCFISVKKERNIKDTKPIIENRLRQSIFG